MIHNPGKDCVGCEKKLLDADPYLRDWFHSLKDEFPTVHICWAFRGEKDQNAAFKDGTSLNKWPTSKHNHTVNGVAHSLAIDLFEINDKGAALWRPDFYNIIYNWSQKAGFDLIRWGGNFVSFRDYPHFFIDKVSDA